MTETDHDAGAPQVRKRRGRPRIYTRPRERLTLELPTEVVAAVDVVADRRGVSRTQVIEAALRGDAEIGPEIGG